jgi:hypothetical protein
MLAVALWPVAAAVPNRRRPHRANVICVREHAARMPSAKQKKNKSELNIFFNVLERLAKREQKGYIITRDPGLSGLH